MKIYYENLKDFFKDIKSDYSLFIKNKESTRSKDDTTIILDFSNSILTNIYLEENLLKDYLEEELTDEAICYRSINKPRSNPKSTNVIENSSSNTKSTSTSTSSFTFTFELPYFFFDSLEYGDLNKPKWNSFKSTLTDLYFLGVNTFIIKF